MGSLTPLGTALVIIFLLAIAGIVISYIRYSVRMVGFEELSGDVRRVARAMRGEVFRDGDDLVISGNFHKMPVIVRFSRKENTPGLNILARLPANFTLTCSPADAAQKEGRVLVRTGDPIFDARFTLRSNHGMEAKMFLGSRHAVAAIKKLCCSSKTYLALTHGTAELSELVIPESYPGKHILEHLRALRVMAQSLKAMPGADTVKVKPMQRERFLLGRAAIAAGVLAAVAAVTAASRDALVLATPPAEADHRLPVGVLPLDADSIPFLQGWRLAGEEDFDPAMRQWMRGNRVQPAGRITADFSGPAESRGHDAAYLLRRDDGAYRVVLLVGGENRFDTGYDQVAGVARIPRSNVAYIPWQASPAEDAQGDALLIVLGRGGPGPGLVVFVNGHRVISGVAANYQTIRLD